MSASPWKAMACLALAAAGLGASYWNPAYAPLHVFLVGLFIWGMWGEEE